MTNHEVTMGDIYQLVTAVRDDVTKINEKLTSVQDTAKDHEIRIRQVELEKAQNTQINELREDLEELKKFMYKALGAVAVITIVASPLIKNYIGA